MLGAVESAEAPGPVLQLGSAPHVQCEDGKTQPLAAADALLIAWLALEGPTPRERLASLLWPDSPAETARNALRQRLFRLRRQCGHDLVEGTSVLALAAAASHDLEHAPTLLAGLQADGFPGLADWLATRRSERQATVRRGTEQQIETLEASGDAAAALPLAQALLQAEPLSEALHRRVMRLHYLAGDRAAALLAFDRLEAVLKDEVGATPSAESIDLLRLIESGAPRTSPAGMPIQRSALPAAVLRPPRLVGRDRELADLHGGWRAGQVILVVGEAGMGKSRLLQSWAATVESLPASSARPGDDLVPYASLARLMTELLAKVHLPLDDGERARLAPLLPGLSQQAPMAPRRGSLLAPVQALLQRAGLQIDGLVLDDLHFADDASIELLQALLTAPRGSAMPMRWCLGLRPPAPGSRLAAFDAALSASTPLLRVSLQPFTVPQIAELLDSLALPGIESAQLAAALRQRSGGNPLFALETLKLAWTDGSLLQGAALPKPLSLGELIGQQLARLSPQALMLARLAAVAGVDFSLPLAETVLGQGALQLADPWHELERQQVIVGTDFAHDLIYEAVLGAIPAVIARHLHGQVAQALEAGGGEPARVAAHWEAAGQRQRALPGLRAAAERAHHALREHERIGFLLRAADIAEGGGDRLQAYDCVADAVETHMNAIRQADGFPLLDRLDRLAGTPRQRANALGLRAWYCSQLADEQQAVAIGEQALRMAEPLGERSLTSQIRQRLATALAMLGRFDEALPQLQAVQTWAESELADDDLAEFHGNFAVVLDNLGLPEQALPHHQRAIAASFAAGNHAQRATQLANQAVNRLNAGDVGQAAGLIAQARQLARTFDLQGGSAGFITVLQLQCARATGRFREALAAADEAEALLRASLPTRLPVVALHRAHCWLDLGQLARAGQALREAGTRLPAHFEVRRLLLQARLQRWTGGDALPFIDLAEAALPSNGWPDVRMMVSLERATLLPADQSVRLLEPVLAQASASGLGGARLAALLRLAVACNDGRLARQALTLAQQVEPSLASRADVWLLAAGALRGAGQDEEAASAAAAGQAWLRQVAQTEVDAPFRESFLQRNPVNAALLAF